MAEKLNRIKIALVEKDMSQKELAKKLGMSFGSVNGYCCNRQQPTLTTLEQIAKILQMPMRELIKED